MKLRKNKLSNTNKQKGITLIALVITIIVLLILAGVMISQITGGDSIMEKAQNAKTATDNSNDEEMVKMAVVTAMADEKTLGMLTQKNLSDALVGKATVSEGSAPWTVTTANGTYEVAETGTVTKTGDEGIPNVTVNVRDVVYYSPNKTYTVDPEYATSYATNDTNYTEYKGTLANGTAYTNLADKTKANDMTITKWKVWKKNGTSLTLVPEAPTTGKLSLHGAQGYNNAVTILDDACSVLYGNGSTITARSMDLEDIEGAMDASAISTAKTSSNFGNTTTYTDYRYYPAIYAYESGAVINGTTPSTATLGTNDKMPGTTGLIGRTEYGATLNGKVQASTSIQTKKTFYYIDYATLTSALGSNMDYIYPCGGSTPTYWLASRCVNLESMAWFSVLRIAGDKRGGGLNNFGAFGSSNTSENGDRVCNFSLFPILNMNTNILQETTREGCTLEVK